jgi:hypothetical protein
MRCGRLGAVTSGSSAGSGEGRRPEGASHVGPYRLVEILGRGGMGEVWLAEDVTGAAGGTPRLVAVKLIDPALAADPTVRARFTREVAALRKVDSPYVAPLLDADADADVPWLASAYVAGPTVADHVATHGPLAEAALRALGVALAGALVAIHAAGVVHRDLTPRNVVLGPDGPRLVDFGIAWFPGAMPVTQVGAAVGTPAWMAPERLTSGGGEATAASDVWSWGTVMAYAAGPGPGPGQLPGWLAPWVRAATAADPAVRPTAVDLRAAMTADGVAMPPYVAETVPDPAPTRPLGDGAAGAAPDPGPWPMQQRPDGTAWTERAAGTDSRAAGAEWARRPEPAAGTERAAGAEWAQPTERTNRAEWTGADRAERAAGAEPTRAFGARVPSGAAGPGRRWPLSLGSAAAVVAVAALVGALAEPLASVIVAAVLVLVALAVQFRRGHAPDRPRPRPAVPPTWSVALASPVVLGVSLAGTFGPLPGIVATVALVVLFVVFAGDILT